MKTLTLATALFLSANSFALTEDVTCSVDIKNADYTSSVSSAKKHIIFSSEDLTPPYVRKDLVTHNSNIYSLVSMGENLALYKIDSLSGKTKLIVFLNLNSEVSLNDIENSVSIVCY